ncbi:MAG: ATP-binding protein, partial [Elusimicrobia bacterium]|nr:ATP-binding protein [Elusimicrobiota bacterium]
MNNETIIEILHNWNFWNKEQDVGVIRDNYLNKIDGFIKTDQIVALTGVRRSGKSTLMKQFIAREIARGKNPKSFLYVNFEEPKFAGFINPEFLQQIYDAYIEIIKPAGPPCLIFVPLDFKEFLGFRRMPIRSISDALAQKTSIKQFLREYFEFGGLPLVALKENKEEILRTYFDDIIGRDIVQRHALRKPDQIKALVRYYLTNFSAQASFRKISKFTGLNLDSLERFSSYMAEAYLIFFKSKFSFSLKEQSVNPRAVYGIDPGLINIVGFRFSENLGRLYENVVFLELYKSGREIYYHKDKKECDFIIKEKGSIKQAIQVSYQLQENKERELSGLIEAMSAFQLKEGLLITESAEGSETIGSAKIIYQP